MEHNANNHKHMRTCIHKDIQKRTQNFKRRDNLICATHWQPNIWLPIIFAVKGQLSSASTSGSCPVSFSELLIPYTSVR